MCVYCIYICAYTYILNCTYVCIFIQTFIFNFYYLCTLVQTYIHIYVYKIYRSMFVYPYMYVYNSYKKRQTNIYLDG